MTRVRLDLETFGPDRRLRVQTTSVDVEPGSHLGRLSLSVEGLVLVSVPLSPWWERLATEPDDEDDDEDQADDDTPPPGVRGPRGFCGHESPDRGDAVFWSCEKPAGHTGWHAAMNGRMGWP